ncbi:MAG: dephospho-CoA kinase [Planctomycetaceae bacterium]|nr:dephospho-CoA kinase [Planctomycetaceae bacterium]
MVGILGGVGSGKSSVVRHVTDLQLQIVDADRIGHEILLRDDIKSKLRAAFGDTIFTDNEVNRSHLAKLVFGDSEEHTSNRTTLNDIVHPAIRREIHHQIDSASMDLDAVILDAALLLEGNWDAHCDWLIFVDTPRETRIQRVIEHRGWTADELKRRESSQTSIAVKRDRADFVVDNSGSLSDSAQQMKRVLQTIVRGGSPQQ